MCKQQSRGSITNETMRLLNSNIGNTNKDDTTEDEATTPTTASLSSSWSSLLLLYLKSYQYMFVIGFVFIGSMIFISLPGFCHYLYITDRVDDDDSLWNVWKIRTNEWIYTLITIFIIGLFYQLRPYHNDDYDNDNTNTKKKTNDTTTASRSRGRCRTMIIPSSTTVILGVFVVINMLWIILPVLESMRGKKKRNQEQQQDQQQQRIPLLQWMDMIGAKAAWPALLNMAMVTIPVQKVSPILQSIGISTHQSLCVHIWSGIAAFVWLLVHTIFLSIVYVTKTENIFTTSTSTNNNNYTSNEASASAYTYTWFELMVPYKSYYTEGVVNFMGWVGVVSFFGLWFTSQPNVLLNKEYYGYELFKIFHYVFAIGLVIASNLHDYNTWFFVQPAIILMIVDLMSRQRTKLIFIDPHHDHHNDQNSNNTNNNYTNNCDDDNGDDIFIDEVIHDTDEQQPTTTTMRSISNTNTNSSSITTDAITNNLNNNNNNQKGRVDFTSMLSVESLSTATLTETTTLPLPLPLQIISLTFPIPNSWLISSSSSSSSSSQTSVGLLLPGMHIVLTVPYLSKWQSHPFSISKLNCTKDHQPSSFTIHIKSLGNWTSTFVKHVQKTIVDDSNSKYNNHDKNCFSSLVSSIPWNIEGPYGSSILYDTVVRSYKYTHCIFIAGGVGVTGVSALAEARYKADKQQQQEYYNTTTKNYDNDEEEPTTTTAHHYCRRDDDDEVVVPRRRTSSLFWMVRTEAEVHFLLPLLYDDCNNNNNRNKNENTICSKTHIWITQKEKQEQERQYAVPPMDNDDINQNNNFNNLMATATTSHKVLWEYSSQPKKTIILFSVILSSIIVMILSRWTCSYQPGKKDDDANIDLHLHECTFLSYSMTCISCDIEGTKQNNNEGTDYNENDNDNNNNLQCCTVPICYYCFRGLPMILSFVLMPLLTLLLSKSLHNAGLMFRSCQRRFFGYNSLYCHHQDDDDDIENNSNAFNNNHTAHSNGIGNNGEVLSTVGAERTWTPRNPACVGANNNDGATIMRTTTSIDRSQQNNIEFHRGPRPENIVSVLSSPRYVSPGFLEPDNTITDSGTTTTPSSSNVLVVLCGPTNLVEKTKRDLANNPLTRSWRVMVAS